MLKDFLEHPFFDVIPGSGSMISDPAIVKDNELIKCPECINLKKVLSDNELAIKDLKKETEKLLSMNKDLMEDLQLKEQLIVDLNLDRQKKETLVKEIKELRINLKQYQKDKDMALEELSEFKKTKLYKQNQSVKKDMLEILEKHDLLLKQIEGEKKENEALSEEVNELKKKVKSEQSIKSKYKKKFAEERTINKHLNTVVESEDNLTLSDDDSSNRYSNNVRQTYYALQGEANVAATNCSKVVEIVGKHMFNIEFQENLPSASTSLNFNREAHIVAKQQVASEILTSDHFTFACDATSRQKAHYLEQHIVHPFSRVF